MGELQIKPRLYLVVDITKIEQDEARNAIVFYTENKEDAEERAFGSEEYVVFEEQ